jgi:spermine synthase
VDDALKLMEVYQREGRRFDIIIGDLTDIPISQTPQDELWVFFRNIISLAFKILNDDGIYLMHVSPPKNGKSFTFGHFGKE